MSAERDLPVGAMQLIDPLALPEPWCWVIWYWLHRHPERVFLPEPDERGTYLLSWDDLRDILVAAGVLSSICTML
jgi:hypothetical protein